MIFFPVKYSSSCCLVILLMITAGIVISCEKPDYNPERRIVNIFTEEESRIWNGYDSYFYSRSKKKLLEVWKWDKQKLIRIESDAWPMDFIYEKSKLKKIISGEDEFYFFYDDKGKLSSMQLYYDKLFSADFIIDEYQNDKVKRFTYSEYRTIPEGGKQLKKEAFLQLLFPDELARQLMKNDKRNGLYRAIIELTYQGDNVILQKLTEPASDFEISYCYTYTSSINPYYFAFHDLQTIAYPLIFSKNNISTSYHRDNEEDILIYNYDIEDNWPVKKCIDKTWAYEWHDRENDTILLIENYIRNYYYYEYE